MFLKRSDQIIEPRKQWPLNQLVEAMAEMIKRWNPEPKPTWITCIPSLNRPHLVPNFSQRLANHLQISFIKAVEKIKTNPPQKTMNNSYQQAHNLDGVFSIDREKVGSGAVFLVDDFVDSKWTLTVVAALLRQAGSGQVFPTTLAINSLS